MIHAEWKNQHTNHTALHSHRVGCPCIRAPCNSQCVWHPASPPLAKPGCSEAGKALGASSLIEKVTGVRGRAWYARDSFHRPIAQTFTVSCQSVKISGFSFQMQPWACARLSTRRAKKLEPLMTFAFIFVLFNPFIFFIMFYDICNSYSCTYPSLCIHTQHPWKKMLLFFFFFFKLMGYVMKITWDC